MFTTFFVTTFFFGDSFFFALYFKMDYQARFLTEAAAGAANTTNVFVVSSVCPNSASFFGFMGVVASLVFASKLCLDQNTNNNHKMRLVFSSNVTNAKFI